VSCVIGLIVSIITSVKLYLNISDSMTNELKMSKDFYTLSIEIFKVLCLNPGDRGMEAVEYLNTKYGHYAKLVESSDLLSKKFTKDELSSRHPSVGVSPLDNSRVRSPSVRGFLTSTATTSV